MNHFKRIARRVLLMSIILPCVAVAAIPYVLGGVRALWQELRDLNRESKQK